MAEEYGGQSEVMGQPAEQPVSDQQVQAPAPVAEQMQQQLPAVEQQQWEGVKAYAASRGIELQGEDDASALDGLLSAYRQSQQPDWYRQVGQQVAPHLEQFRTWLAERGQREQPAQAVKQPWEPPEYREEWLKQLERDETTGELRVRSGYDPGVLDKFQQYQAWQRKFLQTPHEVLGPLVDQRAAQLVQGQLAAFREQMQAEQLVRSNSGWLFQPQTNQLTPQGALYYQAVTGLHERGLRDPVTLDQVARLIVGTASQGGQPPAALAAPVSVAPVGSNGAGLGGAVRAAIGSSPAVSQDGMSLRERLRVNMERAGVPDDVML